MSILVPLLVQYFEDETPKECEANSLSTINDLSPEFLYDRHGRIVGVVDKLIFFLNLYPGQEFYWRHNPNIRAAELRFMAHDKAYDQIAVPSMGTSNPAGKSSENETDSFGKHPTPETVTTAKEVVGKAKECFAVQIGKGRDSVTQENTGGSNCPCDKG